MSERTALEISDKRDYFVRSVMSIRNVPTLPHLCDFGEKAADMLRQQYAEIDRLKRQNAAYATLTKSQELQLSVYRGMADEYRIAVANLDSERAANAILTAERDEAIAAWNKRADQSKELAALILEDQQ